jgi:hypothetical protein
MYSIDPKLWGRPAWDFLFYMAFAYPDNPNTEDRENMKQFLLALGPVLPCEKCRFNYKNHLTTIKLTDESLNSRYNLIIWLINIKNAIAASNGKSGTTYDQVVNKYLFNKSYFNISNILNISPQSAINIVVIVLIIILIIYSKYININ